MKVETEKSATHLRRAQRDGNQVVRVRNGVTDMYERPEPVNPNTTEQQASRAAWSKGCKVWSSLTAQEKEQWKAFAQKHERSFERKKIEPLTGYRLFQAAAKLRQVLGQEIRKAAPTAPPPEGLDKVELLPSSEPRVFRFRLHHGLGNGTGHRVIVSITPATSSRGRKPDRRNGRHIRGWGADSSAPLPKSGGEVVFEEARFAIVPGQRFGAWLRVVRESDGLSRQEFFADLERI